MLKLLSRLFIILFCFSLAGCADWFAPSSPYPGSEQSVALASNPNASSSQPQQVVLLLPMQGGLGSAGQAIRNGFLAAYNNAPTNEKPAHVSVIDTSNTPIQTAYQQALAQHADFIIGPLTKSEVQTLNASGNLSVPVLALNSLDNTQTPVANLYQFGLSPVDEAKQATALASQQGYHSALIIVPAGNWGQNIANVFQQEWLARGGTVAGTLLFSSNNQILNSQLRQFLRFSQPADKKALPSRRHDFDVIFLAATPDAARQIRPLLKFYYVGQTPIYATSLVYSGAPRPGLDNDLNGITFCDAPWALNANSPHADLRQQISVFRPDFKQNVRLYALGVDSYDVMLQLYRSSNTANMQGATGILNFDDQHRVVRQLPCAQFRGGVPTLL